MVSFSNDETHDRLHSGIQKWGGGETVRLDERPLPMYLRRPLKL